MKRLLFFAYTVIAYALFLATFLYAVGFIGNFRFHLTPDLTFVPKSMDAGGESASTASALLIDALLLSVFALQHSGMARRGFKERWTKVVPPAIERSTYVLLTCAALALLFSAWRPIGATVWATHDQLITTALLVLSMVGWLIVFLSTFHIDHFELFGLRQGFNALTGRDPPAHRFVTPGFYKWVRHPLYLGFLIAFWATPVMTIGHLVFAIGTTGYILIAIPLEERDMIHNFGSAYETYRRQVPMLAPLPKRREPSRRAKLAP